MRISKYEGCGNSFLIVKFENDINYKFVAQRFCLKYEADGLIVFKMDPVEMFIFNKDGTEAMMCGNGIRCLMHHLYDKFKIYKYLEIKTKSGIYECEVVNKEPFISSVRFEIGRYVDDIINRKLIIKDKEFIVTGFNLGNLHAMILSDDFKEDSKYLNQIYEDKLFNKEYNISLVKPLSSQVFEILTFERGVGITKSCGTAAASCGYMLQSLYNMNSNLLAVSAGGIMEVEVKDEIILKGETIFIDSYEEERMKVLLVGFGKINQIISNKDSVEVMGVIDTKKKTIKGRPDIIIDFSHPAMLDEAIFYAKNNNCPLLIGTTGYSEEKMAQIKELSLFVPVLISSNFSLGINMITNFLNDNSLVMDDYDKKIIEKHQFDKLDKVSGTATMFSNLLNTKNIESRRVSKTAGEHHIILEDENEIIRLSHITKNREAFVRGVMIASNWLLTKKNGLYKFKDIFNEKL
jgi:diaminopimelate epimerase